MMIILALVMIVIAIYYVHRARHRIVLKNSDSLVVLKPTYAPLIGGVVTMFVYIGILCLALQSTIGSSFNFIFGGIIFLPLLLFGLYNIRYYYSHRLSFNDDRLIIENYKGDRTELAWSDITDISKGLAFPAFTYMSIKIHTDIYPHYIDSCLIGFKNFEVYLDRNSPDMGILLQWRLYHNNDPGNNSL